MRVHVGQLKRTRGQTSQAGLIVSRQAPAAWAGRAASRLYNDGAHRRAVRVRVGGTLVSDGDSLHLNTYSGDDILSQFKDKAMARLGIDSTRAKYVKIRGPLDALDPTTLAPFLERVLLRADPVEKMSKIVFPRGGAGGGACYFVVASPGAFDCALPPRTAPQCASHPCAASPLARAPMVCRCGACPPYACRTCGRLAERACRLPHCVPPTTRALDTSRDARDLRVAAPRLRA